MQVPPILNPTTVADLKEIALAAGDDFFRELVEVFLADLGTRCTAARVAHARLDGAEVARHAHGLRGSAGSMGAERIAAVCVRLDEAAVRDAFPIIGPLLAELETEAVRVRDAFGRELAGR
jgi:HPt (histidine-containing phosphotransfer) domain-containing protein